ncbi:hypothetical protein FEM48_Zijuj01G0192800 [Ziziphus jujuba var. spinosa]|uniref:Uncharacterized protein n=1 Tax=Ziziphus jujuba var. spinosa TaxID=714518 RepID=A0A978W330_ZIZJJ|nr:hypothetical protein FEM48_Zijuj01G0191900 [Ziziphus jujuba var. spinosa]KAH7546364.1 hypothetical protein FEM48_Zijuj01G0192800 [Ziziphus jujuba var. spinosa]
MFIVWLFLVARKALHERISHLKELLGASFLDTVMSFSKQLDSAILSIEALAQNLAPFIMELNEKHEAIMKDLIYLMIDGLLNFKHSVPSSSSGDKKKNGDRKKFKGGKKKGAKDWKNSDLIMPQSD